MPPCKIDTYQDGIRVPFLAIRMLRIAWASKRNASAATSNSSVPRRRRVPTGSSSMNSRRNCPEQCSDAGQWPAHPAMTIGKATVNTEPENTTWWNIRRAWVDAATSVMFTGDSVTDCGRRQDPDGLGDGYVRMVAESQQLPGTLIANSGVSGNRSVDLLQRWRPDVIDHQPDLLSILIGINDTWRRYDRDTPTTAADFDTNYRGLLGDVDTDRTTLVLVEPFLLPVRAEQQSWRDDLDPKIEVVHQLAADFGAILVAADTDLGQVARDVGPAALCHDGVHPTPLGHHHLAQSWLDAVVRDQ